MEHEWRGRGVGRRDGAVGERRDAGVGQWGSGTMGQWGGQHITDDLGERQWRSGVVINFGNIF